MKSLKKLEKFEAGKLEKSQFFTIKGGIFNQTSDTYSLCHTDGTVDED